MSGIFASVVPYVLGLGGDNIFIKDFYAKRIMVIITIPFIVLIIVTSNIRFTIKKVYYLISVLFYLVISFLLKNPINYIIVDLFTLLLPIIFIIITNNIPVEKSSNFYLNKLYIWTLFFSVLIVSFGIKLQYSYLSLIGIIYILFYMKLKTYKSIIFITLLPICFYQSLIGKNAVLLLLILILISLLVEKNTIPKWRKNIILVVMILAGFFLAIFLYDLVIQNDAYKHFIYFLRNADFRTLEFQDASTANRLFEAMTVINKFNNNNILYQFLGNGLGATLDLSSTIDSTVLNANSDPKHVHHIHMGIFAVLHRYGLFGISIYVFFIIFHTINSFFLIRKSNKLYIKLSVLYILIILLDSLISFPHMMSNYFFWFAVALTTRERKLIR
jgi:hypothetical protein